MSVFRRFTEWAGSKFKRQSFPEIEVPTYEDLPAEIVEELGADEIAPTEPEQAQAQAHVPAPQREDFIAAFARLHMPTQTRQLLDVLEKGHTT